MTAMEQSLKTYRRQIEKLLLVKTDASVQFLSELDGNIADFIEAEGITQFSSVQSHFGTPQEIAREFFAQTDITAVRKKLNIKRGIAAALLAALLLWSTALAALYIEARNDLHGEFREEIFYSEGADL